MSPSGGVSFRAGIHAAFRAMSARNRRSAFGSIEPHGHPDHDQEERRSRAAVEEKPREGDMVKVLLATPETAGGEMPEGNPYPLVLGEGQAIPGVEELIMELAPGETKERVVKWPEDFPDETQRGQTKNVRVTLQEVKRKVLP